MTATELLDALDKSGSADEVIAEGRKFVRLMKNDSPHDLIEHFKALNITEGTIHKAHDLLAGRTTPEHYQGKAPPNGKDADAERMARHIVNGLAQLLEDKKAHQADKQAEAQAQSVGNPTKAKEQLVGAGKK